MKSLKKWIAMAALVATAVSTTQTLSAQPYCPGTAYETSQRTPGLSSAIALTTIAGIAVIAVAVQNQSHSSHSHSGAHNKSH